ncbi:mitochondrial outer membrane protein [Grosmannia clavigera kw1407]|uniref:DASH complex subunit DAD4 n=1 Tax=Grosmannia clavigera (strain kw1407 / UAMH 11150) TaxID=655863 RepID=F0XEQ7_GROCL|nr:mitochondrial outer membrane protein [Grosmannia clavigera kw1407]EFX04567.1 mitochondrial outer membrane protein [Grosmannia clavigera kw1407]
MESPHEHQQNLLLSRIITNVEKLNEAVLVMNKALQDINVQNMDVELVAQMFKNYRSNVLFHLEEAPISSVQKLPAVSPSVAMSSTAASASAGASSSYTIFPPIPAPLQRLFDLVPLVTYPANALPDEAPDDEPEEAAVAPPTLFVFSSASDAARGRPSFNPTCLKWQTYLRLAGVAVRLEPSTNHASPSGALPFLQPPRRRGQTAARPVSAHELQAYTKRMAEETARLPSSGQDDSRALAYQALLDTCIRRAWLHAVYLHEKSGSSGRSESIAARLYAHPASTSALVRAALARQLRMAAAAEVWGAQGSSGGQQTGHETAQIYREAQAALQALATLLEDGTERPDETDGQTDQAGPFFFGSHEPSLFDAAVFSYTNLLLEDDDNNASARFRWQDRTLPDAVRALPALVRHRVRILERCWPELAAGQKNTVPSSVTTTADSITWVKL